MEWSASRTGQKYSLNRMLGGTHSLDGRLGKRKISLTENDINNTQQKPPNTTFEKFADHSLAKR
jgi:hypothetical protein